jgi:hypothetical protein
MRKSTEVALWSTTSTRQDSTDAALDDVCKLINSLPSSTKAAFLRRLYTEVEPDSLLQLNTQQTIGKIEKELMATALCAIAERLGGVPQQSQG